MYKKWLMTLFAGLPLMAAGYGCTVSIPTGGGGGLGDGGTGGVDEGTLRVSFNTGGGNYAVGQDDEGNEYTFRAREEDGEMVITEANISTTDGTTLKASLDSDGRPVNFRSADNTNADIVYDGSNASIRYTDADGTVSEGENIDTTSARPLILDKRAKFIDKNATRLQTASSDETTLVLGLELYTEITESIFDDEINVNSPLGDSRIREAAVRLAHLSYLFQIDEVDEADEDQFVDEIVLDDTPDILRHLAGQTFILFDAEGTCVDETGTANRLTFDVNGILQSEFDRYFVFPDFSLGGSSDPGVTINYSTGTPVNLTPSGDVGFDLVVTPVFTGSQLDDNGLITIERRFQADISFDVDSPFGATTATAQQLFDAAFINGTLSADDSVLEFDIQLVDLQDENPVKKLGHARYYNQNSVEPSDRLYTCEVQTGEDLHGRLLTCPGNVNLSEEFSISLELGRDEDPANFDFDWFISSGYGFIVDGEFTQAPTAIATADGFMELTLILHDLNNDPNVFKLYTCQVPVGNILDEQPEDGGTDLFAVNCPQVMTVGLPGFVTADGPGIANYDFHDWFVFGTPNFFFLDPFALGTDLTIYQPGRFEVAFRVFGDNGQEYFHSCEVLVEGELSDPCEGPDFSYYGDGICDSFCAKPDSDCGTGVFVDVCADFGYYGDGYCDSFCIEPDPDCGDQISTDPCEQHGFYGDGICDACPYPDPDCSDVCAEQAYYGDGACDDFCAFPDPDCSTYYDECGELGYYGDGYCDSFCIYPDPDCGGGYGDVCADLGYYGDNICDYYCLYPDPDCGTGADDYCEIYGYYGDGICDPCPTPDPDCGSGYDECAAFGYYGDGICDYYCPQPDSDCDSAGDDICADFGFYGDGICDEFCLLYDYDCDGCVADGFCLAGCSTDPDCQQ